MKCRLTDSHSEPSPAPFLHLPNEPADTQYAIFGGYSKDRKCSGISGPLVPSFAKFGHRQRDMHRTSHDSRLGRCSRSTPPSVLQPVSLGELHLHLRSWQLRGDPADFVTSGDYPRSVNTGRLALAVKVTTYHSQALRLNYVVFRDGTYTRGRRVGRVQATYTVMKIMRTMYEKERKPTAVKSQPPAVAHRTAAGAPQHSSQDATDCLLSYVHANPQTSRRVRAQALRDFSRSCADAGW
jgi:hypothetical protein